jgi:O-Antigen ligase
MCPVQLNLSPLAARSLRLNVACWIGYAALFDLLFLPYFQFTIIPYSLPLLFVGSLLLNIRVKQDWYFFLFITMSIAVVLSSTISLYLPGHTDYRIDNVKRVFQLLTSFVYFFYFRWLTCQTSLKISPILMAFILWVFFLAVMFVIDPSSTNEFIRSIYGRLVISNEIVGKSLRFSYIFTDPNTAGYFLLIAASPFFVASENNKSFVLVLLLCSFMVLVMQSKGALIAFAMMVLVSTIKSVRLRTNQRYVKLTILFVISLIVIGYSQNKPYVTNMIYFAINRLFGSADEYIRGGGRFEIWSMFYSNLMPLPLGRGYVLIIDGVMRLPHSDLIRILYSYGLIALVPALLFFFCRFVSLAPLIAPALMAFLVNSLIDEQKILALFLSLLAILIAQRRQFDAIAVQSIRRQEL